MKNLPDGPVRARIIAKMVAIAQQDAPWIWGFYPKTYSLTQAWSRIGKPSEVGQNTFKYARINPMERAAKRREWNRPVWWPVILSLLILIGSVIPVIVLYRRREHRPKVRSWK